MGTLQTFCNCPTYRITSFQQFPIIEELDVHEDERLLVYIQVCFIFESKDHLCSFLSATAKYDLFYSTLPVGSPRQTIVT